MLLPNLGGALVTMPPHDPGLVINPPELLRGNPQFLYSLEGPHPEQILLEDTHESFSAPIALRFPHEGRKGRDPLIASPLLERYRTRIDSHGHDGG